MNHKFSRMIGCVLLTTALGLKLASAQTTPAGAASSSSFGGARKPIPVQSAPSDVKSPQYHLPGLAPDLVQNLVVVLPGNPPPLYVAARGAVPRSAARSAAPLSGGRLVELGGYDR